MYFQYDTNGTPLGFIYNGTQYLYMTNQMGDVISITDAQGNELVQYEYDEWGAVASIYSPHNNESEIAIANINPLRYRGYYYDAETDYYYLQSRYYDASICRFINADNADVAKDFKNKINGTNIFIYCLNNPTNSFDLNGHITVNLKNKKISNVIVKFARKLMSSWSVTASVNSQKYILKSVCGVTLYIGASASTSLNAMKNNISSGNGNLKVSNKCSLNYKKAKLSYSTATTYKNNTLKAVVTLGTTAITYGLSLITKYFYTSRASCYYSIDLGLRISHWTTAAATVIVAGVCVAAPYIAPAVGKIYTSVLSSIASYKAFVRGLTAIAGAGMTIATKLA